VFHFIALAASEAAIALAIVRAPGVPRNYRSIMADRMTALKN
jgi:NADH:ubiquinone oxidoreductase subunit K